jgi:hypothetical protein
MCSVVPALDKALTSNLDRLPLEALRARVLQAWAAVALGRGVIKTWVLPLAKQGTAISPSDLYRIASASCVALQSGPMLACTLCERLLSSSPSGSSTEAAEVGSIGLSVYCQAAMELVGLVGAIKQEGDRVSCLVHSTLLAHPALACFLEHLARLADNLKPAPGGEGQALSRLSTLACRPQQLLPRAHLCNLA